MKKRVLKFVPYFGIILLQGLHAPTTVAVMMGEAVIPLFVPLVTIVALCCYMINAIVTNNKLYILSNSIGIVVSICLATAIIYT